jgi:hypothetical protein
MIELKSFDPMTLVWLALLNPAVVAVGFWLGRQADQWQKIPVAAFAAALAGFAVFWLGTFVGLIIVGSQGGASAVMMLQFAFGLVWAGLGYLTRPSTKE